MNMIKKIESGPVEVVLSGTVIAFSGNPIIITLGEQGKAPLKIILEFKDEEGKPDNQVQWNIIDSLTLKGTLFNFKNTLGSGSTKPISIGTLGGRQLYLQYRVYALTADTDKMLHYTLYRGKEVKKNG